MVRGATAKVTARCERNCAWNFYEPGIRTQLRTGTTVMECPGSRKSLSFHVFRGNRAWEEDSPYFPCVGFLEHDTGGRRTFRISRMLGLSLTAAIVILAGPDQPDQ